jgi:hypothetical protein
MTAVLPARATPAGEPAPAGTGRPTAPQPGRAQPRVSSDGASRHWPWPVAALLTGAVGALWPVPTLVALVCGAALLLAFAAPRATAALTAVAVLFVRPLEHLVPIPQVGYLDEGLVILCAVTLPLRRVLARRPLRTFPGQWWFAAFVVLGVLSGLALHVPVAIFATGAFVISKGLLFAWAVAQVDWDERHLVRAAQVGVVLILFTLLAAGVNLAIPGAWEAVLASDANAVEARSFLPSLIGPFTHPLDLGQFMALSFVAVASWRATVRRTPLTLVLMGATALGALATARRTAAGSLAVAWFWLQAKRRSTAVLVALVACLPVAVVVLAAPLTTVVTATYTDYFGSGNPEARTVMTLDSFAVAADHFPGGAGFGRFGSAVAAENYSPEYVARGYPYVWGLGRTEEDGRFLTDTEWPAVIGETGFLGAIAFAAGLVAIYRACLRRWVHGATPLVRWAGLMCAGWLVAGLVQSVATVTFTGPPTFGLLFGLVGILAALGDTGDSPTGPAPRALLRAGRRPIP